MTTAALTPLVNAAGRVGLATCFYCKGCWPWAFGSSPSMTTHVEQEHDLWHIWPLFYYKSPWVALVSTMQQVQRALGPHLCIPLPPEAILNQDQTSLVTKCLNHKWQIHPTIHVTFNIIQWCQAAHLERELKGARTYIALFQLYHLFKNADMSPSLSDNRFQNF